MFLRGRPCDGAGVLSVPDRFRGTPAFEVPLADAGMIDAAVAAAHASIESCARWPLHARAAVLRRVGEEVERSAGLFVETIITEAGKPVGDAKAEVARAVETFRTAAEECSRALEGETMRLDMSPRGEGRRAISQRVAAGALTLITPFNFPLNLVAHKVAPAIAAGCPWVLKPSDKAPVSALLLGAILLKCGLPEGSWSILPARVEEARALVTDDRLALLSFTGSAKVGWGLKSACGRKKIVLELGGDATSIVEPSADLDHAAARVCVGGYSYAGQSCISVQHVLAQASVYAELRARLVRGVAALGFGDPRDPLTSVGPLINEGEAIRVESWVRRAEAGGAKVLCGGERRGPVVTPTLIENVPPGCELATEEVFGPVVCLASYGRLDEAFTRVNAGRFGLQCGVFTRELPAALRAWGALHVGAVVINDVPTFRTEAMPYGGVKQSGLGREGVRRAIHEFTEERLLILDSGGAS